MIKKIGFSFKYAPFLCCCPMNPPNLDHNMPRLPTFCFNVAEAMGFPKLHGISILALTKAGCVTSAKFLNFSEPWFPPL